MGIKGVGSRASGSLFVIGSISAMGIYACHSFTGPKRPSVMWTLLTQRPSIYIWTFKSMVYIYIYIYRGFKCMHEGSPVQLKMRTAGLPTLVLFLLIVVKVGGRPTTLLDEPKTEEWCTNELHILLNNAPQVFEFWVFLLLDQLPYQNWRAPSTRAGRKKERFRLFARAFARTVSSSSFSFDNRHTTGASTHEHLSLSICVCVCVYVFIWYKRPGLIFLFNFSWFRAKWCKCWLLLKNCPKFFFKHFLKEKLMCC